MKKLMLIACAVLLAGCAANPTIVSSSDKMVVVETSYADAAIKKADAECAKQSKKARLYRNDRERFWYFDCL